VAPFHERRLGAELEECAARALHVDGRAHLAARENRGLVQVRRHEPCERHETPGDQVLGIALEQPISEVATMTGSST